MKRDDWTVPYRGEQLLNAARTKEHFHAQRRDWWAGKKSEIMDTLKSEGITINESVVDELGKFGYSTANTGFATPQVRIDEKLQRQLGESVMKVREHEEKIAAYGAWIQMLEAHQNDSFALDHDDYIYFFGK